MAENLTDENGEVKYKKGTLLTKEMVDALKDDEFFEKGAHTLELQVNTKLDEHSRVNLVKVYADEKREKECNVIGTDLNLTVARVTISDIVAIFSYFINLMDGFGDVDDIDHLSNRRIRCVGELIQTKFRICLTKMAKKIQQIMSKTSGIEDM